MCLVENRGKQNPKMNSNSDSSKLSQVPKSFAWASYIDHFTWLWILVCIYFSSFCPIFNQKSRFDFHSKTKILFQKIKIFPMSGIDKRYSTKFFEVGDRSLLLSIHILTTKKNAQITKIFRKKIFDS